MSKQPPLRFAYINAKGTKTRRELITWQQNNHYIRGIQSIDNGFRTFRKDQIIEMYYDQKEFEQSIYPDAEKGILKWNGQKMVYYSPSQLIKIIKENYPEIAFTGFLAKARAQLEQQAKEAGLCVRKTVTVNLNYLCTGYNAGPSKVMKALAMGIVIMDEEAFKWMMETGEIPV